MAKKFKQLLQEKGNRSAITDELRGELLFKVGPGLYSDRKQISTLEYLTSRYPSAIFCSYSAFYYYGMTDVIPQYHYLAIERKSTRIKEDNVSLSFYNEKNFKTGLTQMTYNKINIAIYDRERLLIDLINFRNQYEPDYYKTIIDYYRKHINALDTVKLEQYAEKFKNSDHLLKVIYAEVY
ncbi:MAG: hypothetical protein NTV44_05900 [Firmicutes bacterium]|nr:hypothetical protein [Bacillota bacterium]